MVPPLSHSAAEAVIRHHLRIFGVRDVQVLVLNAPGARDVARVNAACASGMSVVIMDASDEFCVAFSVRQTTACDTAPRVLSLNFDSDKPWARLRTLHGTRGFQHQRGVPVVTCSLDDEAVWLWLASGAAGILWIGTSLAADLVQYRQGDPSCAENHSDTSLWGFAGERPLYLFEPQLAGEAPDERHADWWAWALVRSLTRHAAIELSTILPNGAPGAVIVTGDDDQAALENYAMQLNALGEVPITYFLHPKTKHDLGSMTRLFTGKRIDLGLHPDAIEEPENYAALFRDQCSWYEHLCGSKPASVRNHGFLNDGYWGHLPAWLEAGIRFSSNLPGLNGRVLNGSLLPARMIWNDELTDHWSILTAIGDGVVFALGRSSEESGDVVRHLARKIRASGVPGIIVINLHPDNVGATLEMHHAVREVCASGFLAWTVRDCVDWFDFGEPDLRESDAGANSLEKKSL